MTRTMYDSTTAADIPLSAELVAGYIDGVYAWSAADWAMHAGKPQVRIAVFPTTNDGQVLDLEPGNGDASVAVAWARMRRAAGQRDVTIYCFSDAGPVGFRISDVRDAFDAAGEPRPLFWVAQWDNDPSTFDPAGDPTIVAKQYAGSGQTGGHYDASIVADFWPGVDAASASTDIQFAGQGPAVVTVEAGEVAILDAIFTYGGQPRVIRRKAVSLERGTAKHYPVYPPVDPDADLTERVDVQPAHFIVVVRP